ncbi:MAG: hypothetical protein AAGL96_10995 [Pseudomonadota bacterium]
MDRPAEELQEFDLRRQRALAYLRQMRAARADMERVRRARRLLPVPATEQAVAVLDHVAANDLNSIAGVGPGLIWALGNCGIHSRAGLGSADRRELGAALGPVGAILNIDDLRERARTPAEALP